MVADSLLITLPVIWNQNDDSVNLDKQLSRVRSNPNSQDTACVTWSFIGWVLAKPLDRQWPQKWLICLITTVALNDTLCIPGIRAYYLNRCLIREWGDDICIIIFPKGDFYQLSACSWRGIRSFTAMVAVIKWPGAVSTSATRSKHACWGDYCRFVFIGCSIIYSIYAGLYIRVSSVWVEWIKSTSVLLLY